MRKNSRRSGGSLHAPANWYADRPVARAAAQSLAVPMILLILLIWTIIGWTRWDAGDVDRDIPPAEARSRLGTLLEQTYQTDPTAVIEVVRAHEEHGGLRGKGSAWYLIRLDPDRAAAFEASFVAAARQRFGGGFGPLDARPVDPEWFRPMGWGAQPPAGSHAWRLNNLNPNCAVFFDNQCYFYFWTS